MIVAILCASPSSGYALEVLQALNARGLNGVHVIAAENTEPNTLSALWRRYGWQLPGFILHKIGVRISRWCSRWYTPFMQDSRSLREEVMAQGGQFVCVPDVNHNDCRQRLLSLQVDLLVLTGTPIVRDPILSVPCIGVLNAHQGALPEFRGMNVIEWAVLEGYQPALSIHFVDAGVDTGDLIFSESILVAPGDTLSSLRLRSGQRQAELLADAVLAAQSGSLPRQSQKGEGGRQFYMMHPRVRRIAEQCLQAWHASSPTIQSTSQQPKAHLQ
jgi:hypothetical protein